METLGTLVFQEYVATVALKDTLGPQDAEV